MSYNGISFESIASQEIDMTVATSVLIGTTNPSTSNFLVQDVLIFLTDISGLISIPQNISVGYTGPNYNDFVNNGTRDLENVGEFGRLPLQTVILSPAGGIDIFAKIGIAAVATTYKVRFVLLGYYF